MGRGEKWLFPKFYSGINQSTVGKRAHTGCAAAKGRSTQLSASRSPDNNKSAMSKRCCMVSFQTPGIFELMTQKPAMSFQKALLIQYTLLKIDFLYFLLLSSKMFDT